MEEIRKKLRIMLGEPDENGCFYEVSEEELLALFSQSNKELVEELAKLKSSPLRLNKKLFNKLAKAEGFEKAIVMHLFWDLALDLAISKIKEKGSIKE